MQAPATAQFGQSISVAWTVANNGNGLAQGSWGDQVYLSSQATLGPGAMLLSTQSGTANSPLAVGAGYSGSAQVTLPSAGGMAAGTYYVIVVSDGTQSVPEANGIAAQAASSAITVSLPPLPALSVSGLPAATQNVGRRSITELVLDGGQRRRVNGDGSLDGRGRLVGERDAG